MSDIVIFEGGIEFTATSPEDEPTAADLDVGKALGFKDARAVRKLIKRLIETGFFPENSWRDTVSRQKLPGNLGEREITTYRLSERAALIIGARSDTPEAPKMLRRLVDVYVAVGKRLHEMASGAEHEARLLAEHTAQGLATELAEQRRELAQALVKVDMLDATVRNLDPLGDGMIGKHGTWQIRHLLKEIAKLRAKMRVGPLDEPTNGQLSAQFTKIDNELRVYLAYPRGRRMGYEHLPHMQKGPAVRWCQAELAKTQSDYDDWKNQTYEPESESQVEMFALRNGPGLAKTKPKNAIINLAEAKRKRGQE